MAKQVRKKETGFDKLARLIKSESDDIREHMATKEDLKRFATKEDVRVIINETVPGIIDEKLQPIINELVSIRKELLDLRRRAENNAGLTKEIDHGLERIGAIERHLGLKTISA